MFRLIREEVKIKRIHKNGDKELINDNVAVDLSFCIFVDDLPFRTLITSSDKLRELSIGHLFTEGVIKSINDIQKESITKERADIWLKNPQNVSEVNYKRNMILTTACNDEIIDGSAINEYKITQKHTPKPETIFEVINQLNSKSLTYRSTGGTHSAILFSKEANFNISLEDVGRHNAVDKVLGAGLIKGVTFSKCILGSSGRLSGEIVLKAARAGVPIICSVSAPLLSGINIAKHVGIELYGFVRARRFNKYTGL
jgi:FdhD protein